MPFVSYAQNYEDVMLYRALKNIERGFYIDIGAQGPIIHSVTKAFYEKGWRGINIEPVPYWHNKLLADRPEDINLQVAVGSDNGTMDFFEVVDTGLSTTNTDYAQQYKSKGFTVQEYTVSMLTLENICKDNKVKEIHFLKIDVEGAEKSVLESIDFSSTRPWIVIVEATEPNSTIECWQAWEAVLIESDYSFAYYDGLNRFYVAVEHVELKNYFVIPPNVFDNFITYEQSEAQQLAASFENLLHKSHQEKRALISRVSELELEYERLLKLFTDQQNDLSTLSSQLNNLNQEKISLIAEKYLLTEQMHIKEQEVMAIYNSLSWRSTSGLRQTKKILSNVFSSINSINAPERKEFLITKGTAEFQSLVASVKKNKNSTGQRQFLIDVTHIFKCHGKTGVERLLQSITLALSNIISEEFHLKLVYCDSENIYRCADDPATPVKVQSGDIFLGLGIALNAIPECASMLASWTDQNVQIYFLLHDILPLRTPHFFIPDMIPMFARWFTAIISLADGILCISQSVADDLNTWLNTIQFERKRSLKIGYFHLGADIKANLSSEDWNNQSKILVDSLRLRPTFLMVGTLEPRKGHAQTLLAFDKLWSENLDINLVIIGKQGWLIEQFIDRLHNHPERGHRLFWLESASDQILLYLYKNSTAILMPSEGEGFGLPLIEAAKYNCAIIARDIPVFREIAGEHAFYFEGLSPENLAQAIKSWLRLYKLKQAPMSNNIPQLTWHESAQQLLDIILKDRWYKTISFAQAQSPFKSQQQEFCQTNHFATSQEHQVPK